MDSHFDASIGDILVGMTERRETVRT